MTERLNNNNNMIIRLKSYKEKCSRIGRQDVLDCGMDGLFF